MEQRAYLAPQHPTASSTLSLTLSDQDTDSEDDLVLNHARTSKEVAAHDRSVLEQEEERERLLSQGGGRGRGLRKMLSGGLRGEAGGKVMIGKRQRGERRERRRTERRAKRRGGEEMEGKREEEGGLMYEMEEGVGRTGTWESGDSYGDDEGEDQEMLDAKRDTTGLAGKTSTSRCTSILIYAAILVLFLILLLLAYRATLSMHIPPGLPPYLMPASNGSHVIPPTTILLSLDGLRASFLSLPHHNDPAKLLTPNLHRLIDAGLSPAYMLPSFPSVTFPNHYTLVTGLHPESHGVVSNTFFDPLSQKQFHYTDPARSMQAEWWNAAEPLWVTAEKQGKRAAVHMWPGSEAHIFPGVEPSIVDKFNESEALPRKVDRILHWLDLPAIFTPMDEHDSLELEGPARETRPQLIAAYVPNIDVAGHKYGPNSTDILEVIASVDDMIGALLDGIAARNLSSIVNLVVVSDHGMATTAVDRLIQLEDLLDTSLVRHIDGWPLYGLRLRKSRGLMPLHADLLRQTKNNTVGNVKVYLRDSTMPERYHFSENPRIAPLWLVPETGWAIVKKDEFDVAEAKSSGTSYSPRGLHGYDNEHPLMRAIFVGRGPAFAQPKTGQNKVDVFQNTEVYSLVCDSLGITPEKNNGTLRLPLTAIGAHPPPQMAAVPADPPASSSKVEAPSATLGIDRPSPPPAAGNRLGVDVDVPIPPPPRPEDSASEEEAKKEMKLWEKLKAKLMRIKAWIQWKVAGGEEPDEKPGEHEKED